MRKSEFLTLRRGYWGRLFDRSSLSAEHHIGLDLDAAEAAGVTWDPEEPEWPDKIETMCLGGRWGVWVGKSPDPPRYLTEAQAAEVARRYNIWTRLEELITRWQDIRNYTPYYALELRHIMQAGTPGSDEEVDEA